MNFKRNVGSIDSTIRLIVGFALLSQVFIGLETAWGWIGIVLIATAVTGYCGPYALLGVNTCSVKKPSNGPKKTQSV